MLLFLPPLSPSLSLLLWCVQKRKSSSSVHLMVSLACPPIRPLHAACARLPATQTHSAMCVCFTHPHCMSVLGGQVWPILPGGGHCPRSPSGLKSGHWNVWCGTPCYRAQIASSSPGQEVKRAGIWSQVASTRRDPHCHSGGEPCSPGTNSHVPQAGSHWTSVWWAEELVVGSRP